MKRETFLDRAIDFIASRTPDRVSDFLSPRTIDRAIGLISPMTEARRIRARMAVASLARSYEGASRGKRTKNWTATNQDVNAVIAGGLSTLRARSRDLVRNNPYASKAIEVIETNVVGCGIIPQARSENAKLAKAYESLWLQWGEETLCDADGQLDFYGIQGLAMRTIAESGSVLIRRRRRKASDGLPVPLQLQVLEPDFLDTTRDSQLASGNIIVQGIEFDKIGRRVAYWMYDQHPGGRWPQLKGIQSFRVPAEEIIHVFRVERSGQVDGVPWGAPCVLRMRDLDEYEDAHLIRQKIASCFAAFVHDIEALEDQTNKTDEEKDALSRLEPGTIEYLAPGKEVTFGTPPAVQGYGEHTGSMLRSISCGFGVTYESLTNDYSQVNFSSGRMGWIEMNRNVQKWQHVMLMPRLCRGVWRWFAEAAMLTGAVGEFVPATWTPPRREMIDPVKETEALKAQVRAGFLTLSEAVRQLGYDPASVFKEYAADLSVLDKLGLTFDTDPRRPASGAATAVAALPAASGD